MRIIVLFITMCIIINSAHSTTVSITRHNCPICRTQNSFQDIRSGYQAQFDLHQYLDWTYTQSYSVYCCTNCWYSALKLDFGIVPAEKLELIKSFLKTLNFKNKYTDYAVIPVTIKLEIAEKIYWILGRNDEFWCNFYRILGFHYGEEQKQEMAKAARFKALLYSHLMLTDRHNKGREKEIYYIIATMNYFTGQEKSALLYLDKAAKYTYMNYTLTKEVSNAIDNRLSNFIDEYPNFIKEQKYRNINVSN